MTIIIKNIQCTLFRYYCMLIIFKQKVSKKKKKIEKWKITVTTPPLALVAFPRLGCQTKPSRPTVLVPALEVMQNGTAYRR